MENAKAGSNNIHYPIFMPSCLFLIFAPEIKDMGWMKTFEEFMFLRRYKAIKVMRNQVPVQEEGIPYLLENNM